jgi:hypothetical protein
MFVSEYEIQKRTGLPLELLDRLTKDGYDLLALGILCDLWEINKANLLAMRQLNNIGAKETSIAEVELLLEISLGHFSIPNRKIPLLPNRPKYLDMKNSLFCLDNSIIAEIIKLPIETIQYIRETNKKAYKQLKLGTLCKLLELNRSDVHMLYNLQNINF